MWGDRQINHTAERQREGGSAFVWRTWRGWIVCLADVCWYSQAAAAAAAGGASKDGAAAEQHLLAANLAGGPVGRAEGGGGRGRRHALPSGLTWMWVKWRLLFYRAAATKCSESSRQTKSIGIDCTMLGPSRYIPNKSRKTPRLPSLIPSKSRLNTFQGAEVIGVCVVALLYHCLPPDMYVYHKSNLQKAC